MRAAGVGWRNTIAARSLEAGLAQDTEGARVREDVLHLESWNAIEQQESQ